MKIGIFSDLHSNIYALNEMFMDGVEVEKWICLGDFVGLFPNVNEVIEELDKRMVITVKGDHEVYLLSDRKMSYSTTGNDSIEKQREILKPENKEFIANLEESISLDLNGLNIFASHRLILDDNSSDSKYSINLELIDSEYGRFDILLYGHTHLPLVTYCKNLLVMNPGSAGFPVDLIKKPSYIIFDSNNLSYQIRRFEFNKQLLLQDIKANNYNPKFLDYIRNHFRWTS